MQYRKNRRLDQGIDYAYLPDLIDHHPLTLLSIVMSPGWCYNHNCLMSRIIAHSPNSNKIKTTATQGDLSRK